MKLRVRESLLSFSDARHDDIFGGRGGGGKKGSVSEFLSAGIVLPFNISLPSPHYVGSDFLMSRVVVCLLVSSYSIVYIKIMDDDSLTSFFKYSSARGGRGGGNYTVEYSTVIVLCRMTFQRFDKWCVYIGLRLTKERRS